ncbi:MAG: hypothetical protein QF486_00275 [Candidatus Woesearchaeota archaeon]|nr:hypothetical protein [Candidatus Woesearchaeota archaeon]MDP7198040.1 hypothetical protein [Candidatus Woesearchaeota archaeon]
MADILSRTVGEQKEFLYQENRKLVDDLTGPHLNSIVSLVGSSTPR